MVSKEFADETQPGVTLALDLFRHPYAPAETKHTPFEWAVKVAASIGDYANRRGYPLTLATNDEALPAPVGSDQLVLAAAISGAGPAGRRSAAGARRSRVCRCKRS